MELDYSILREDHVPSADIYVLSNGIMHIHILVEEEFRIENSMEIVEARNKIAEGKKHPILYTANEYVIPSKEVREYVASEGRSELVIADAFVIKSLPQRILARTFMRFNSPVRPTKIFENKEHAMEWLQAFTDDQ